MKFSKVLGTFFLCVQHTGQTLAIYCREYFLRRVYLTFWSLFSRAFLMFLGYRPNIVRSSKSIWMDE